MYYAIRSFAYITDNAYTVDMIFKMECAMLAALGFKIVVPTEARTRQSGGATCLTLLV